MINLPLTGGCQCGSIRYQLTEPPVTFYLCHCRDCQKQSSSAFGLTLWSSRNGFRLLSGVLSIFDTAGESGALKRCTFCNLCGTRIYHCNADSAGHYSIKAGSLDSLQNIEPVAHIWTRSAHPWAIHREDHLPRFEADPADDLILVSLWNQAINAS